MERNCSTKGKGMETSYRAKVCNSRQLMFMNTGMKAVHSYLRACLFVFLIYLL